jgi:hypothetical protein
LAIAARSGNKYTHDIADRAPHGTLDGEALFQAASEDLCEGEPGDLGERIQGPPSE